MITSPTKTALEQARKDGRGVLIGYFPAGYPNAKESVAACQTMLDNGVDILELGVPYSDPVMDGLVIQEATEQAIANGFKLRDIFPIIREIKEKSTKPVLVMSYWNPVMQYGVAKFAKELAEAGAAGLITPDLIPDEAAAWFEASDEHGLDRVFLVAPSSSPSRVAAAVSASRGFTYAVSTMGITGERDDLDRLARGVVARITESDSEAEPCVGIGISTAAQVAEVNGYASAAIVGSAFIKAYASGGETALRAKVIELASGKSPEVSA